MEKVADTPRRQGPPPETLSPRKELRDATGREKEAARRSIACLKFAQELTHLQQPSWRVIAQMPNLFWQARHLGALPHKPFLPDEIVSEILAFEMSLIHAGKCAAVRIECTSPRANLPRTALEEIVSRANNQISLTADVDYLTRQLLNVPRPSKLLESIKKYRTKHRSRAFKKLAKDLQNSLDSREKYHAVLRKIIEKAKEKQNR